MKAQVFDRQKKKSAEVELPSQFLEEYRPDLIKRAVHALQSAARQRYGTDPLAGMRHSTKLSKRRRKYRGCYGFGISRVNRKIFSRRGTRFNWAGAFSPQTRGGRRAHPPKAEKNLEKKLNIKENKKAIRSAMAATLVKSIVEERGHKIPIEYPFLLDSSLEDLNKTKDVEKVLTDLGFGEELERSLVKKIRAGLGKLRGRKYRRKKGILVVVSGECPLLKSAKNVPGVDVVEVKSLNAELLAPGAVPGRAALWTQKAVEAVGKEKLFV
ncbi:MAG: 50S ribosomal protein L4 [Nanoarchaeota archaeon]|nr:50S ribosomal protein L4 [Nanoarchaeota archaeon]MBU1644491.1 50S ribosomal protein L4 [Nanoarchaeota archaeon]MBU1976495.1 50S ribosomal protein L4 [Nanoarchaeota archaeon]